MNNCILNRPILKVSQRLLALCLAFFVALSFSCSTTNSQPKAGLPQAGKSSPQSALQSALEKIGSDYPEMNVGVSMVFVQDKKTLFNHHEHKLFTPASTAKLLTLAAALHYLGPQYRYDTELYADKRHGSIIHNLSLKASGDPSLSSSDIAKLITELKQLGVRTVTGDIVVDASIFDEVAYGNGWMVSDLDEGYSAPVSGISVDHNRIAFGIFPALTAKKPIYITTFPSTNYFTVKSRALTGITSSAPRLKLAIDAKAKKGIAVASAGIMHGSSVLIEGNIPLGSKVKYETLAIRHPTDFAAHLMQEELKKNGIQFKGKLRMGQVPPTALLLTHHYSSPLCEMLIDFVKMSNNHATETLLKTIGVVQSGAPGTYENGISAVRQFLETQAGVSLKGLVAADGSGLSRYNQISAKQLTDLLTYMWNNFQIGPEFVTSLALFGEDGTLKNGSSNALKKNVRAKTGTMRNLRSLAGYMRLDSGEVVAFAVLTNGSASTPQSQKRVIEDILTTIKGQVDPAKTASL